ncbi:MAG TPA: flagellar hook-length control protein FliK [Gammaproteobacteria bacterium]
MINIPPIKLGTEIKTERLPDISQIWKTGQVLNATVETGSETMDRILLRIGQHLVESKTPMPLKTGDQIKLLVKTLGETPLLAIQTKLDTPDIAADKLRAFIAQQINPLQLMNTTQKVLNTESISPALKQQLQLLVNQIPDIEEILQPQQLSRLIKNSGVFLEPRLLANSAQIQQDIKGQLLKLNNLLQQELPTTPNQAGDTKQLQKIISDFIRGDTNLQQLVRSLYNALPRESMQQLLQAISGNRQPALPEEFMPALNQLLTNIKQQPQAKALTETLIKLIQNTQALQELKASVEQTLARITSQQLIPLTREADNPLLLLLGLIFKDKDSSYLVDFRIEQEHKTQDEQQTQWSVTLNFNFPTLGAIQSQLHLTGDKLATTFHAEHASTAKTIEQHLPLLQSALQKAGLEITRLEVTQQTIKPPRDIPKDIHILDEKA